VNFQLQGGRYISTDLNILFVDDHADTREALSKLLQRRGYGVVTASSYDSAIHKASAMRFDLVIADIGLPDGNGLNILPEIRKLYPVRGIVISGYNQLTEIQQSAEAGYDRFLSKPFTAEALYEAVEKE
jgi:DNA-binding NtrC family response regulator